MKSIHTASDTSLAPTLRPLASRAGGQVRDAFRAVAAAGFRAVQLDATLPGLRPRELGARDRRDLAGLLTRSHLRPAGLDLWIPKDHFTDPAHVDRAMEATLAVVTLAADLGRVPVSVGLPVSRLSGDVRDQLVAAADGRSVPLAVHDEGDLDALCQWIDGVDLPVLGAGLDPAALMNLEADPAATAQRLGSRIVSARLSDTEKRPGTPRVTPGSGDLDLLAYRMSVEVSGGPRRVGPVVLDLRGLDQPLAAAEAARRDWGAAVPDLG